MWNCCLTGVWSSLGVGRHPHHSFESNYLYIVVWYYVFVLLSDSQYLPKSTSISTNSETAMLSSLEGWLFSGFLFAVFTWGPPCHVVLSFTKAAKYATKYSKEIVFWFCIRKDISVWHQTDNKSYYWAHHSTPQPICLPLFMFKFWNPSPFTRKLSRQFVVFLRDLKSEVIGADCKFIQLTRCGVFLTFEENISREEIPSLPSCCWIIHEEAHYISTYV